MSLITKAMEKSYIMDKTTSLDEYGSVNEDYKEGAEIMIAYSFDTSTPARIAAQEGIKNRYTLTTSKAVVLKFPTIVKRASDGKMFQITSDGTDNATPDSSGLNIRQVEAEEWRKP